MMHFKDLSKILGGSLVHYYENSELRHLLTDSRKLADFQKGLFFALKGPAHDGHNFLEDIYSKGCRNFIVSDSFPDSLASDSNVIKHENPMLALQSLAEHHRSNFNGQVIGITGSNGKTIVKEWLFELLSSRTRVVKSPMSYNSQLGVPLSIWQIQPHHQYAIIEAGISKPGEMEKLESIVHPEIGIFTNIGKAHQEGFSSRENKIVEKAKLFAGSEMVICCADHDLVINTLRSKNIPLFTWGRSVENDIRLISTHQENGSLKVEYEFKAKRGEIRLPDSSDVYLENAMHCFSLMMYLGYDSEDIRTSLWQLPSVEQRLKVSEGINGCTLIDDTYNNDLTGLEVAIDQLHKQPSNKSRVVILSDSYETGMEKRELYARINELLNTRGVDKLIAVGPDLSENSDLFSLDSEFYSSTGELIAAFSPVDFASANILVKGARMFGLERVVNLLRKSGHGTILEINLNQVTRNLNYYRSKLSENVKIMAMVKALAYGSGSMEMAAHLVMNGVDYFGVAYADEGVSIRKHGIEAPIMVMNPPPEVFPILENYNLEAEVYSLTQLDRLVRYLAGRELGIHIKIETGMHRLGFEPEEVDELKGVLKKNQNLKVKSIFSHLASSEDPEQEEFTSRQAMSLYHTMLSIREVLEYSPILHVLNSGGISRYPQFQFGMVRLGIGMHGYSPNVKDNLHIKPTQKLKTFVAQVKSVKTGDTVGYGRSGKVYKESKIATLGIGYADGYSRLFSNGKGSVLIRGKRAPVVGKVCMDMTMVDVTGMEVDEGDEVIIFGEEPTIEELAQELGTIPYEILSGVSDRVRRVYVYE